MILYEHMKTFHGPCGHSGCGSLWFYPTKCMVSSRRVLLSYIRTSCPQVLLGTDLSRLWRCPRMSPAIQNRNSNPSCHAKPTPNPNSIPNRIIDQFCDISAYMGPWCSLFNDINRTADPVYRTCPVRSYLDHPLEDRSAAGRRFCTHSFGLSAVENPESLKKYGKELNLNLCSACVHDRTHIVEHTLSVCLVVP